MSVTTVERPAASVFHGLEMGRLGHWRLFLFQTPHVEAESAVKIVVISKEFCFKIWKED